MEYIPGVRDTGGGYAPKAGWYGERATGIGCDDGNSDGCGCGCNDCDWGGACGGTTTTFDKPLFLTAPLLLLLLLLLEPLLQLLLAPMPINPPVLAPPPPATPIADPGGAPSPTPDTPPIRFPLLPPETAGSSKGLLALILSPTTDTIDEEPAEWPTTTPERDNRDDDRDDVYVRQHNLFMYFICLEFLRFHFIREMICDQIIVI